MKDLPKIERLNNGLPLVQRIADHPWENKVTFNPACAFVSDASELSRIISALPFSLGIKKSLSTESGLCFLLYRAQGKPSPEYDFSHSSVGLAVLNPQLKLLARHTEPVLLPDQSYDNLGVEDGRITKVGDRYVMVYTAYSSGTPESKIRLALASTTDFVHWEKHGLLKGSLNEIHNKNGMIFEQTVGRKFVMLHRPMQGPHAMAIHWAESDDVFEEWNDRGVLMEPIRNPAFTDTWIGGGAPPISVGKDRFLMIYHIGNRKASGDREYDLGIAVADFASGKIILRRAEPLLRPETPAETIPDAELGVANVLFVCGAYFFREDLYLPYAGADSVVLAGKIPKNELRRYLES
ncbi:MAG TPA: glycosidase [Bacteroidota bacterium]|nr:glycosidase [Bacteroidota bacterium]